MPPENVRKLQGGLSWGMGGECWINGLKWVMKIFGWLSLVVFFLIEVHYLHTYSKVIFLKIMTNIHGSGKVTCTPKI